MVRAIVYIAAPYQEPAHRQEQELARQSTICGAYLTERRIRPNEAESYVDREFQAGSTLGYRTALRKPLDREQTYSLPLIISSREVFDPDPLKQIAIEWALMRKHFDVISVEDEPTFDGYKGIERLFHAAEMSQHAAALELDATMRELADENKRLSHQLAEDKKKVRQRLDGSHQSFLASLAENVRKSKTPQLQLAKLAGVSQPTVHRLLDGKDIKVSKAEKPCLALGLTIGTARLKKKQ